MYPLGDADALLLCHSSSETWPRVLVAGRSWRYTPAMRECLGFTLVLLYSSLAASQTVPGGWKIVKDVKAACQIAVPPEWVPLGENVGAAVFHASTTAIAVVTS